MDNDEQEQLATKIREFASNAHEKIKRESSKYCTGASQNKRNGFNVFRSGMFSMLSKKWFIPTWILLKNIRIRISNKISGKTYFQKSQHKEKESKYYP